MYDRPRLDADTTTDSAQFVTRYRAPGYDLRYLLGWTRSTDHLHGSRTTGVDQTALGTRGRTRSSAAGRRPT